MAYKTTDQLSTISGIADGDYLLVYDLTEPSNEKLKKMAYSDFMSSAAIDVTVTAIGVTLNDDNDIVEVTGDNQTVYLHSAITAAQKRYDIKNTSATNLTVSGTQLIDESNTVTIPTYESRTLVPTGSKWIII